MTGSMEMIQMKMGSIILNEDDTEQKDEERREGDEERKDKDEEQNI